MLLLILSAAKVPRNYLSCSCSGYFNLHLRYTSRVRFWFKPGHAWPSVDYYNLNINRLRSSQIIWTNFEASSTLASIFFIRWILSPEEKRKNLTSSNSTSRLSSSGFKICCSIVFANFVPDVGLTKTSSGFDLAPCDDVISVWWFSKISGLWIGLIGKKTFQGSGCGSSVGRAVASDSRGPQLKSTVLHFSAAILLLNLFMALTPSLVVNEGAAKSRDCESDPARIEVDSISILLQKVHCCDSICSTVASSTRGLRIKSSHQQNLYWTLTVNCFEKMKKIPRMAHFFKTVHCLFEKTKS